MKENDTIKTIVRGSLFVFSVFLLAFSYNLLFLPNDLVIGGVGGIAIILNDLTGIDSSLVIYIANGILITLSYFLLGKEKTKNTIVGAILYPVMITLSLPIATFLLPYMNFNDFWITGLLAGLSFGLGSGMVFRYGYSTGGSDIMISIFSKYLKFPEGQSMLFINIMIILVGGLTFGLEMVIYGLLVLYLSSLILDKVMFDISNSKVFYVFSSKEKEVEKVILKEFNTGFTILPTKGGYSKKDTTLMMAVLPNRDYYHFKNRILDVDPGAFFIICDCYESQGGFKKKNIPYV